MAASPFLRDTATCPVGKVTIGGGSQVVGEGTADFRTQLQESSPGTIGGGAQSLWLTALRNNDASPHTIGLFAVCAKLPSGYEVVRKDVIVPAGGFLRDTAVCPVGKVALAGGSAVVGEGTGDFKTRLQESAPGTIGGGAQSLWLTALRNADVTKHTIGLFAVCGNRPSGYQIVRKDTVVAPGGFLRTTANCPAGKVVMGGGASVIGEGTADFRTRMQESTPGHDRLAVGLGPPGRRAQRRPPALAQDRRPRRLHARPSAYEVVRRDLVTG